MGAKQHILHDVCVYRASKARSQLNGMLLSQTCLNTVKGKSAEYACSGTLRRGPREQIVLPCSDGPTQVGTTPTVAFRTLLSEEHVELEVALELSEAREEAEGNVSWAHDILCKSFTLVALAVLGRR